MPIIAKASCGLYRCKVFRRPCGPWVEYWIQPGSRYLLVTLQWCIKLSGTLLFTSFLLYCPGMACPYLISLISTPGKNAEAYLRYFSWFSSVAASIGKMYILSFKGVWWIVLPRICLYFSKVWSSSKKRLSQSFSERILFGSKISSALTIR